MKKVIILIIVLLSFGIIGFGIYYASTYNFNDNKNSDNKKENVELNKNSIEIESKDAVTLVDTVENEGIFVQKYQIIINGLEKILEIEFLNNNNENEKYFTIIGKFNGAILYYYYQKYEKENIEYSKNMIDNSFNEKNFSFIKGEDGKSYLLIHSNIYDDGTGEEDKLYILNDSFKFVNNDLIDYSGNSNTLGMTIMSTYINYSLENNIYPWYTDNFSSCSTPSNCNIDLKVEDNKIYCLVPVFNNNEDELGKIEERVYIINNSNLKYEVINQYKIENINKLAT